MTRRVFVASDPVTSTPHGECMLDSVVREQSVTLGEGGWIVCNRPELLLWAQEIYMSGASFSHAHEHWQDPRSQEAARVFLDRLEIEGILRVINEESVLPTTTMESIWTHVGNDCELGPKHCAVESCGQTWCAYTIAAAYTSLTLSRFVGASCIASPSTETYLRTRFGEIAASHEDLRRTFGSAGIKELYDVFVPSSFKSPVCHEPIGEPGCENCRQHATALALRSLDQLLVKRESRELKALARYVDDHWDELCEDSSAAIQTLHRDLVRHQARLASRESEVKRWARIASLSSLPLSLVGMSSDNSLLKLAGPALAALSVGTEQLGTALFDTHSWRTTLATNIDYTQLARVLSARQES